MIDRRDFLRFLGAGLGVAAAPTKAYSFLGGILRPRAVWDVWGKDGSIIICWNWDKVYGIYPKGFHALTSGKS